MLKNFGKLNLEYVDCAICETSQTEVLPYFHCEKPFEDLQLRRCTNCGLIFQSPRLSEPEQAEIYDKSYFEKGEFGGKDKENSYFNPQEQANLEKFHSKIIKRIQAIKAPPAKILEVGCAGGHFLLTAKKYGYQVSGVEISEYAAKQARTRYNLDVVTGTLTSNTFPSSSIDIIYLKDVLEHIPQPVPFLKECLRILKKDGLLVILVPNYINSEILKLYIFIWEHFTRLKRLIWSDRNLYLLNKPFHIYEFTSSTLTKLVEKCGFQVKNTETYTLAPLRAPHRGIISGMLRYILRWMYLIIVKMKFFEGDRLDLYCIPKK